MYTVVTIFSLLVVLVAPRALAADITGDDGSLVSRYDAMVAGEQERTSKEKAFEHIMGGSAAIVIGMYGYYNNAEGILAKLVYGGVQTSGVIVLCRSLLAYNEPSMLLSLNRRIKSDEALTREQLMDDMVRWRDKHEYSSKLTLAASTSILGFMYFYNGYRTPAGDLKLRDVMYFLSANMFLVAGTTWYQIWNYKAKDRVSSGWYFEPGPVTRLVWEF